MVWWVGVLAGCGAISEPRVVSEGAPPPVAMTLSVGRALSGRPLTVTAAGASPGASVTFFRSVVGSGVGPCLPTGGCLDIEQPNVIGVATADTGGVARLTRTLPTGAFGSSWMQAAVTTGPYVESQALQVRVASFTRDLDADELSDADEVIAGTDLTDPDTDGDGAVDSVEVRRHMDPLDPDTDGDGIGDGGDVWPLDPGPHDSFVVDDVVVSDPGDSLPDPEFDGPSQRFVWQDDDGTAVWVATVDAATGDFIPEDGRGVLVDVNVSPISAGHNGPEWVYGPTGTEILYTRDVGPDIMTARAREVGGAWQVDILPDSQGAMSPIGSLDPGDPHPRLRYQYKPGSQYLSGWREINDPSTDQILPLTLRFSRWVPGRRWLVGASRVGGIDQVHVVDIDSGAVDQVTTTASDKGSVFYWEAPELGGEMLFFVTHADVPDHPEQMVVYRQIAGQWTPIKTISTPPAFPFAVSPEPFTWNGRSYVSYLATTGAFNYDNGEAQVWLAALTPGDDLNRRISLPDAVIRKDPEPYTGSVDPWVYYSRVLGDGRRVLRRCALGL